MLAAFMRSEGKFAAKEEPAGLNGIVFPLCREAT